jgi:hypothetical protein
MISMHGLGTVREVARKIAAGRVLLLAGEETLLAQLPRGRWLGATAANFMTETGGVTNRTHVFYTDITTYAETVEIHHFNAAEMRAVGQKYPANGFAVAIVPGLSPFLAAFAHEVLEYEGIFNAPLIGWVSGVHPSDIKLKTPKTFAGGPVAADDRAAVMYVTLPSNFAVHLSILNLFAAGKGPKIEFTEDGFLASGDCLIDGKPANLARYIAEQNIDTKLPLVADQDGAMVNVSILSIDKIRETVRFFAPVFKSMVYRFAKPVPDYPAAFEEACAEMEIGNTVFSCNCILNFLYAGLEGKHSGPFVGPMTFGEIAYTVLNQTLAYLSVTKMDEVDVAA